MALITVKFEAAPDLVLAIERLAAGLSLQQYHILEAHDQAQETAAATDNEPKTSQLNPVPIQPSSTPIQQVPVQQQTAQVQPATAVPVQQQIDTEGQISPTDSATPSQATAVPTQEQTYTLEQLAIAGTQLIDAGKREALQQLLAGFGVQALTQLPKENYGAFATQLRQLGAKI